MDGILQAHAALESKSNLTKALTNVDQLIHLLQTTRDSIADGPDMTALHMAKLKNPLKTSFDKIEDDLKEVNRGLNQYQKALKDKFKNSSLPTAGVGEGAAVGGSGSGGGVGGLTSQKGLVERVIAMHLLREGKFEVASTFVKEVSAQPSGATGVEVDGMVVDGGRDTVNGNGWVDDFADQDDEAIDDDDNDEELYGDLGRGHLQKKFAEMYHILDALRNQNNLAPAIDWARQHSAELEARGSNLEFELSRLKFVQLYTSISSSPYDNASDFAGLVRALDYARATFPTFHPRYARETAALLGALAFSPSLASSPYKPLFQVHESTGATDIYTHVSTLLTQDYTSLLGLPPASPLHTAITAGAIALPLLSKVNRIMTQTRGQWSSVNELPVETPLPPGYVFHSIFVCPVSKEQATDANPPMMLPCGHVIARESLEQHGMGKARVKCPYCPVECRAGEARRVYI